MALTKAARIQKLANELDKLCTRHAKACSAKPAKPAKKTAKRATRAKTVKASARKTSSVTTAQLIAAIKEVDRRGRYGGLVPIKAIRSHLGASHEAMRDALSKAEKTWDVDLKIANDPSLIKDKSEAYQGLPGHDAHSWIEYVVAR